MLGSGPWYKLNTIQLFEINQRAVELNLSRCLDEEALLRDIDPAGWHMITRMWECERNITRYQVLIKVEGSMKPVTAFLDGEHEFIRTKTIPILDPAKYQQAFDKLNQML